MFIDRGNSCIWKGLILVWFHMYALNVFSQIFITDASIGAIVAFERLFSGVRHVMPLELWEVADYLGAVQTRIQLGSTVVAGCQVELTPWSNGRTDSIRAVNVGGALRLRFIEENCWLKDKTIKTLLAAKIIIEHCQFLSYFYWTNILHLSNLRDSFQLIVWFAYNQLRWHLYVVYMYA